MNDLEGGGEYRKLVLAELQRLNGLVMALTESVNSLNIVVAQIQVKAGIAGGLIGMVAGSVISVIVAIVLKK